MVSFLSLGGRSPFLSIIVFFVAVRGYGGDHEPAIKFIENKNQWPAHVHYAARIPGGNMVVSPGAFSYYFLDHAALEAQHERSHMPKVGDASPENMVKGHALQVTFRGANLHSKPLPFGRLSEYHNFYIGSDAAKWAAEAHAYSGVLYPSFYDHIDLKVYSAGDNLKYDFVVSPSGDPALIMLDYLGADSLALHDGDLRVTMPLGEVIEKKPIAYQFIDNRKVYVPCRYVLNGTRLSFSFPQGYDACYPLVVDPLLIFSTYSGSAADNWGSTATPGEHGTLYSSGITNHFVTELVNGFPTTVFSGTFPATAGAFQTTYGGGFDIGILKYDSLGKQLLYATYLGGNSTESPHSLVVNSNEELVLLGTTSSTNFPTTTGAFDRTFNGGNGFTDFDHVLPYANGSDIVVARFNKTGTSLLASTYLGGTSNDGLNNVGGALNVNYGDEIRGDVITDAAGNIYISTVTASNNFSLGTTGFDLAYNGGLTDAVVIKLNTTLSAILWGTYLGGAGTDAAYTIKLDSQGNICVAGGTTSGDFPMAGVGHRITKSTDVDGWILKIDKDGTALLHGTFTGTNAFDQVYIIDLNQQDEVYVYGQTDNRLDNFPFTAGAYRNPRSGQFVQKFNSSLTAVGFSTVFGSGGGLPDISPTAFLVNDCNNLYMTGWGGEVNSGAPFWGTNTVGMDVSPDAFQKNTSGSDFYLLVLTDDASTFLYATYLGGSQSRTHVDGGTSRFDKNGIVYHAVCSGCRALNAAGRATSDFPTTVGAWSRTNRSRNCNNAAFKFDLSSLKARLQTNSVRLDQPGLSTVCMPDKIVFQNKSIGGKLFEWDMGDGTTIVKNDTSAVVHEYKNTGPHLVTLKVTDPNTCIVTDMTSTIVNVNRIDAVIQGDDDVCYGSSYRLNAQGGAFYEWGTLGGAVFSNEARPVVTLTDTARFFVTVTAANGCSKKDTMQVNVIDGITPALEVRRTAECAGRPRLTITNLTDSLQSDDIMFVSFGDGQVTDLPQVDHAYEKDGVYEVRLTGTRHGCVYEKSVTLPVFTVKVPNVITPGNTEGLNDRFTVQYGETEGVTPGTYGYKVTLAVYNRWGRLLYQNDDYQYDWSGEGIASGIYYYDLSIQDHNPCKGWLHLVK